MFGKLENILNNFDQSAASVLTGDSPQKSDQTESLRQVQHQQPPVSQKLNYSLPVEPTGQPKIDQTKYQSQRGNTNYSPATALSKSDSTPNFRSSPSLSSTSKRKAAVNVPDPDEALFDFLNRPVVATASNTKPLTSNSTSLPLKPPLYNTVTTNSSLSSGDLSSKSFASEPISSSSSEDSIKSVIEVQKPDKLDVSQTLVALGNNVDLPQKTNPVTDLATTSTFSGRDEPNNHGQSHASRNNRANSNPMSEAIDRIPAIPVAISSSSSAGGGCAPDPNELQLENSMLREEINSLNDEMSILIKKRNQEQLEYQKASSDIESYRTQLSRLDQVVREMRGKEDDLAESLAAKDSQLGVLRVRLEEADSTIKHQRAEITSLSSEVDRLNSEHNETSSVHSLALESLKERVKLLEASLEEEKRHSESLRRDVNADTNEKKSQQMQLVADLQATERRLNDEKARSAEFSAHLQQTRHTADLLRTELKDYKEKAGRILQSKDKLISSLQQRQLHIQTNGTPTVAGSTGGTGVAYEVHSSSGSSPSPDNSTTSLPFSPQLDPRSTGAYIEQLQREKEALREELFQTQNSIENLRLEMIDLESHSQHSLDQLHDSIRDLKEQLADEKAKSDFANQELESARLETRSANEELYKLRLSSRDEVSQLTTKLAEANNKFAKMSAATVNNSDGNGSGGSSSELESRVQALTESLIKKQTVIEALSTEKNSLVFQLERLEKQYTDVTNGATPYSSSSGFRSSYANGGAINVAIPTGGSSSDDDQLRQRPNFMRESPFDTQVTRGMKRAANSLDGFSIRLGLMLRRYPIARLFVIAYMLLLHAWVMLVLLTYQPETHATTGMLPHDPHPKPPGAAALPVAPGGGAPS